MTGYVFDSSALLTVAFGGSGGEDAAGYLPDGMVSSVNAAEVISRYIDKGASDDQARRGFEDLGLVVRAFDEGLAALAGLLRRKTRNRAISLGDRACLALALREGATVITADPTWADLDLGLEVIVVR